MGGHGGLNILPQKRWNVYNYDNREKVRRDEEAAAREDQLKLEQSRRRDFEFRLEKLRQGRGLTNSLSSASSVPAATAADSGHINLFAGLKDFDSLVGESVAAGTDEKEAADVASNKSSKKRRREDAPVKMTLEDEKYKLGYGLIGKGVQAPWYASKRSLLSSEDADEGAGGWRSSDASASGSGKKSGGKKTVEELREERMRREKQEKERERSLLASVGKKRNDRGFSRRRV